MKRLILLLTLTLLISSCSAIMESMYEPVNPADTTTVTIEVPEGSTFKGVAKELADKKLISSAMALTNYVDDNALSAKLQKGTYQIAPSMDIATIATLLTAHPEEKPTVKVTFPEGFEVKDIIKRLQEKGFAKDQAAFEKVLVEHPFDYKFLEGVDRSLRLEGYLFPDTYQFYTDATDVEIVTKMLDNFNKKYTEEFYNRAEELGLTTNEVITLASIVEREARKREEFPLVAGVFINRIEDKMPLEACSTVQFILGERKPVLSIADTKIDSPYNTYQIPGLPPGPIAQPSLLAIKSVLYPEASDYLFFVVANKGDGSHLFAKTYAEHLKNIEISKENLKNAQ